METRLLAPKRNAIPRVGGFARVTVDQLRKQLHLFAPCSMIPLIGDDCDAAWLLSLNVDEVRRHDHFCKYYSSQHRLSTS